MAHGNKVNITWQVKVKRLQKCYLFWGFKVKSCLTLCRHILGNELEEITQNRTKCYHFILGKWVNTENKVMIWQLKTTNNKINAAISIFIRIHFRCSQYVSFSQTFKCRKIRQYLYVRCWKYVTIVRFSACKNVSKWTFYRTTFYVKYIRIIMRSRCFKCTVRQF